MSGLHHLSMPDLRGRGIILAAMSRFCGVNPRTIRVQPIRALSFLTRWDFVRGVGVVWRTADGALVAHSGELEALFFSGRVPPSATLNERRALTLQLGSGSDVNAVVKFNSHAAEQVNELTKQLKKGMSHVSPPH